MFSSLARSRRSLLVFSVAPNFTLKRQIALESSVAMRRTSLSKEESNAFYTMVVNETGYSRIQYLVGEFKVKLNLNNLLSRHITNDPHRQKTTGDQNAHLMG